MKATRDVLSWVLIVMAFGYIGYRFVKVAQGADAAPCCPVVSLTVPAGLLANTQFTVSGGYSPVPSTISVSVKKGKMLTLYTATAANGSYTCNITLPAGTYTIEASVDGTAAVDSKVVTVAP